MSTRNSYRGAPHDPTTCPACRAMVNMARESRTNLTAKERAEIELLRAMSGRAKVDASPHPAVTVAVAEIERLVGRRIGIVEHTGARLTVVQRCGVCRDEVRAVVTARHDERELVERLPYEIGRTYLMHECRPVVPLLQNLTPDQLEELRMQLERESVRLSERVLEIERLQGRRSP